MPEYHYRLGGLAITSEHQLCHAQPLAAGGQASDVRISTQSEPIIPDAHWQAFADWVHGDRERIFFEIPDTAQFLVSKGRSIDIHILPGVPWDAVELYLLGTAMGVIYHQRGIHPLHAACVARDDAAIAIAGDSGEGKTTLAYAMTRRGYDLLTDDVAPLTPNADGFLVHQEKPVFKIWQETATHFAVPVDGLSAVNNRDHKYYLPIADTQRPASPLRALVVLATDDACRAPRLEPVPRLQALACIRQHTYRNFLVPLLWGEEAFLQQSLQLAHAVDLWRLVRPRSLDHLEAAADVIAAL